MSVIFAQGTTNTHIPAQKHLHAHNNGEMYIEQYHQGVTTDSFRPETTRFLPLATLLSISIWSIAFL